MHDSALRLPQEVLIAYGLTASHLTISTLGRGRINDTYLVLSNDGGVVLQRLNGAVFPRPGEVAENFHIVTSHIAKAAAAQHISFVCPRLILTKNGEAAFMAADGSWWRGQSYIDHVCPQQVPSGNERIHQLGQVLATFHLLTESLEVTRLYDPLPGFHITSEYLRKYDGVLRRLSLADTEHLAWYIDYIERFRESANVLERAKSCGELAVRVMHGDPKTDNVIFQRGGQAVGLFDLDTVGPGLIHYDIGDCLRSVCNLAGEGAREPGTVRFDLPSCAELLRGYMSIGGENLSNREKRYIYDAVLIMTFELGVRFFTDHLQGDLYFKVAKRGDNLQRALVQFNLASSIASQGEEIRALTEG